MKYESTYHFLASIPPRLYKATSLDDKKKVTGVYMCVYEGMLFIQCTVVSTTGVEIGERFRGLVYFPCLQHQCQRGVLVRMGL